MGVAQFVRLAAVVWVCCGGGCRGIGEEQGWAARGCCVVCVLHVVKPMKEMKPFIQSSLLPMVGQILIGITFCRKSARPYQKTKHVLKRNRTVYHSKFVLP